MKRILTVGHSNRSLREFLALLGEHDVQVLVDVRSFPTSRHQHFTREHLAPALAAAGVRYLWLGKWLGGYRRGGYKQWMCSSEFARGIDFLQWAGQRWVVAIMCAERLFFRCHRRFIADVLVQHGWEVVHIMDQGRTYRHRGRREQPTLPL